MTFGRLLLVLLVLGAGLWILRSQHLLGPAAPEAERPAPIERARTAAQSSEAATARTQAEAAAVESQPPSGGNAVSENMTPDQVRALLGEPDSMELEATETRGTIQKWVYSRVGKTVVFENGVVARVE
jgi:hypothetical protein